MASSTRRATLILVVLGVAIPVVTVVAWPGISTKRVEVVESYQGEPLRGYSRKSRFSGLRNGETVLWYVRTGTLARLDVVSSGVTKQRTYWLSDGKVEKQVRKFDDSGEWLPIDERERAEPPWWWGVTDETEPTAPWWKGKE